MNYGYSGKVTLVSPDGTTEMVVKLRGRDKAENGQLAVRNASWLYPSQLKQELAKDRRFYRLLSQGWTVKSDKPAPEEEKSEGKKPRQGDAGKKGQEQKKGTTKVDGSRQSGQESHGGDHSSEEVQDSPNAAQKKEEKQQKRGSRGQRGSKAKSCRQQARRMKKYQKTLGASRQQANQRTGGLGFFSPQPARASKEQLKSAEQSAELLAELVGRSQLKVQQGVTVDAHRLLVALETGDNPLPPLETPRERPRLRVLITPDSSGSTQSWSGLGCAWAHHLSKLPDVDVVLIDNFNGELWDGVYTLPTPQLEELLASVDVVIYLGDGDGYDLCHRYAGMGSTVVALDCYSANYGTPRLREVTEKQSGGTVYWVDRVHAKAPETWYLALQLVLAR